MKRPGGFDELPEQPAAPKRTTPTRGAPKQATPVCTAPVQETPAEVGPEPETTSKSAISHTLARFAPAQRTADPVKAAERRVREAERRHQRSRRSETKRFTQSIRKVRRRVLISISAVLLLVLFVLVGAFTPLMAVRDVQVEGAASVNVDEVTGALQQFDGVPLALVDETDVLRALEAFPLIQRFAVERVPPHTLLVRIEERVPAIALETDDVFRQYDAAGVLVAETAERPEGVPLGEGSLRTTSSAAFGAASKIVRDMPGDLRAQLDSVKATSNQDVTFMLTNGIEVFWGSADETKRKALVLQTMLTSLEGRAVSHIDVSSTSAPIFR